MDPSIVLQEIGGGLAGVVMVVEFLIIIRLQKRIDVLTDKLIEREATGAQRAIDMHGRTLDGMAAHTAAIQATNVTQQATLAALEKRA